MGTCALCGRPTSWHDRHVLFPLPTPVTRLAERERTPGTWATSTDPTAAVMMRVPGAGSFLRALLPVRMLGGHCLVYGVWVAVTPADLERARTVWWRSEYVDLRLSGRLANDVRPWGLLAATVELAVVSADETPYCVASDDPDLARVLAHVWPHDTVLAALAGR